MVLGILLNILLGFGNTNLKFLRGLGIWILDIDKRKAYHGFLSDIDPYGIIEIFVVSN